MLKFIFIFSTLALVLAGQVSIVRAEVAVVAAGQEQISVADATVPELRVSEQSFVNVTRSKIDALIADNFQGAINMVKFNQDNFRAPLKLVIRSGRVVRRFPINFFSNSPLVVRM